MPIERYFIDTPVLQQGHILLEGPEFHHLAHVVRIRKGEQIELVNGQGLLAQAIVKDITKSRADLEVINIEIAKKRETQVILAQAFPKVNRLDFVMEKGTELGVDEFWLFPGQLSIKKDISPNQLERLHSLVIAAMKQCGRLFLPRIEIKPPLDKWSSFPNTSFFGDVEPHAPLFANDWHQASPTSPILFFVGPESGFSDKEIKTLRQKGVRGVKLHSNILRTDTAPLVALSLIEHWLLDSGS